MENELTQKKGIGMLLLKDGYVNGSVYAQDATIQIKDGRYYDSKSIILYGKGYFNNITKRGIISFNWRQREIAEI